MAGVFCHTCNQFATLGINVEVEDYSLNEEELGVDVEVHFELVCVECEEPLGEVTKTGTIFSVELGEYNLEEEDVDTDALEIVDVQADPLIEKRKGKKLYIAACTADLKYKTRNYVAKGEVCAAFSDFDLF